MSLKYHTIAMIFFQIWRPHVHGYIFELMNLIFDFPCEQTLRTGPVLVLSITFPFASCS